MALLPILRYPDARLHKVAQPVATVDAALRQLIDDMFETMYEAKGIGLAATQVDVHQRLIVIDVSEERNERLVLINPELLWASDERVKGDEGCLSVPGFYETVERPEHISVTALDRNGKEFTIKPEGLLAVCIQHELDHLNGKLFVDYISAFKRGRIKKKLEKKHKEEAR